MSESLDVLTWGLRDQLLSVISYVGSEDIPVIFTLMQNKKTDKLHSFIFLFFECAKIIVIMH